MSSSLHGIHAWDWTRGKQLYGVWKGRRDQRWAWLVRIGARNGLASYYSSISSHPDLIVLWRNGTTIWRAWRMIGRRSASGNTVNHTGIPKPGPSSPSDRTCTPPPMTSSTWKTPYRTGTTKGIITITKRRPATLPLEELRRVDTTRR